VADIDGIEQKGRGKQLEQAVGVTVIIIPALAHPKPPARHASHYGQDCVQMAAKYRTRSL
jgi:hypothetical protein